MTTQREFTCRRPLSVILAFAALCAVLVGPVGGARPAHAAVTFDQKMLELINKHRADAGVAPVQPNLVLNVVAGPGPYLGCGLPIGGRAADMGARNYFSHTLLNCGGQTVFNILSATVGLVYSAAGENIAWMNGTTDPIIAAQNLMGTLMNSPGHKANILNPKFTHVGIGFWTTSPGQQWTGAGTPLNNVWVTAQVFAQMPLSAAPAATVSPTNLSFGDRLVGSPAPAQTVTVANGGSATLTISSIATGGANADDFPITSSNCETTVASGASCSIGIGFNPRAVGARSANLIVSDNASGSPRSVTLNGNGTGAPLPPKPINPSEVVKVTTSPDGRPLNDFDGNGTTDLAVFRPASGGWYLRTATPSVVPWGQEGDVPVPGDYNGDGITDIAVFRPASNAWYLRTPTPQFVVWGEAGDVPVPGDYDGNGTTDIAVFRPSTGTWFLRTASPTSVVWGQSGDVAVPGDYDGNGTVDIAVFRPSNGAWYLRTTTPQFVQWGQAGDITAPADYDGNGTTDVAVFRPSNGTWYLRTASPTAVVWGQSGDVPVAGDYDGNGTTDVAVFRPSNSSWYLRTPTPVFVT